MGYSLQNTDQDKAKKRRPVRIFHYKKQQEQVSAWANSPFTEMPEELKHEPSRFARVMKGILNFLLMTILVLTLIALVLAFAYELIYHPEVLVTWSQNLVNTIVSFFQQLLPS